MSKLFFGFAKILTDEQQSRGFLLFGVVAGLSTVTVCQFMNIIINLKKCISCVHRVPSLEGFLLNQLKSTHYFRITFFVSSHIFCLFLYQ